MRVLSVVRRGYYGSRSAVEPMFLYFTLPLRDLGHDVDTFDHYAERSTERLLEKIRSGGYQAVFYQTSGSEPIDTSALADLSKRVCIAAWNSDDDWQWETTRRLAGHFTWMITTYPSVYEANRTAVPNLLLSQWGCLTQFGRFDAAKDIDFSFAGAAYGSRNPACRYLRRNAGLVCYGRGSRLVHLGLPYFRGAFKLPWLSGPPIDFESINDIWNRSRVSYTPMSGGPRGDVLSIKSRTFDMGLSGTLMLCEKSPDLDRYYEPGKEFVAFESLEECADKARWYLQHEEERARIAAAYRDRTLKEHLWKHRFVELFRQMGL
jgi:spore maturation protein CgeB